MRRVLDIIYFLHFQLDIGINLVVGKDIAFFQEIAALSSAFSASRSEPHTVSMPLRSSAGRS